MQTALIGIGSNQAAWGLPPAEVLARAARALGRLGEASLSPLYESPAWPDPSAPPYVNAVALLETGLSPEALLAACLAVEAGFGRRREGRARYAPRPLDLDLLAVGPAVRETAALTLPHPRIAERDFVLLPLRDVAPGWRHPVTGEGASEMLGRLTVTARRLQPAA